MATRVGVRTAARAVLAALVASASGSALALGLGELEMQSFLNEPLQARVELLDTRDLTADDIRIRLAGVEDFDRLGVDRTFFLTSMRGSVPTSSLPRTSAASTSTWTPARGAA